MSPTGISLIILEALCSRSSKLVQSALEAAVLLLDKVACQSASFVNEMLELRKGKSTDEPLHHCSCNVVGGSCSHIRKAWPDRLQLRQGQTFTQDLLSILAALWPIRFDCPRAQAILTKYVAAFESTCSEFLEGIEEQDPRQFVGLNKPKARKDPDLREYLTSKMVEDGKAPTTQAAVRSMKGQKGNGLSAAWMQRAVSWASVDHVPSTGTMISIWFV